MTTETTLTRPPEHGAATGSMRICVTHHHACDCREKAIGELIRNLMELALDNRLDEDERSFVDPARRYVELRNEAVSLGYHHGKVVDLPNEERPEMTEKINADSPSTPTQSALGQSAGSISVCVHCGKHQGDHWRAYNGGPQVYCHSLLNTSRNFLESKPCALPVIAEAKPSDDEQNLASPSRGSGS